ncbi:hypothetical protein [Phenylobacterium sp.]|jgi:hypothetical protein|uniref:hypothetical protein n=1 Tax=Phenylobacterium sp. TaxID=1871053 RepID=UPI002E379BC2|nr:hypothetical protein [Phenylobacterium sp.]HEX4712718.1 hypothetical protein [Phenylobacterium sp.]
MAGNRNLSAAWRSVALALVALSLAVKVLVPAGFMVAADGGTPGLVICTGHGPVTLAALGEGPSKAPAQKKSDAPCAFAGSTTPPTPSLVAAIAEPYAQPPLRIAAIRSSHVAPGRGLAAPPPPSHAPPIFSI